MCINFCKVSEEVEEYNKDTINNAEQYEFLAREVREDLTLFRETFETIFSVPIYYCFFLNLIYFSNFLYQRMTHATIGFSLRG